MKYVPTILFFVLTIAAAGIALKDSTRPLWAQANPIHPRLLFLENEIPALRNKINDGLANDDVAYDYVIQQADVLAAENNTTTLVGSDFGLHNLPILGLAYQLTTDANPNRATYRTKCQTIMTSLRITYTPTGVEGGAADTVFESATRLFVLAYGFDWCYDNVSGAGRNLMIAEMESYLSYVTAAHNTPWSNDWQNKRFAPYAQNKGFMAASALGLTSIVLRGETANTTLLNDAETSAEEILDASLSLILQDDGAYTEGVLYAAWSMRFIIPYFEARIRYDGVDYGQDPGVANFINWLAYEIRPSTDNRINNTNDALYNTHPLSMHTTALSWAQTKYDSGVAKWIFEKAGKVIDYGRNKDNVGIVLWDKDIQPVNPATVVPSSKLFSNRGLYYFRTGWPDVGQVESKDSVFSLYAGTFHGGHAQEDQGQFTLYSKYEDFIVDTGYSDQAKHTSGHNLILIDGADQHNAGSSVGTDAAIASSLLTPFTDYLRAELKDAYTTHSPYNDNDYPWPGIDWSWGHSGANPVIKADRTVLTIKGSEVGEYFVLYDDFNKDNGSHAYDLLLHTRLSNTFNTTANPIILTGANKGNTLSIYLAYPTHGDVSFTQSTFATNNGDGNTKRLAIRRTATNPNFFTIFFPRETGTGGPTFSMTPLAFAGGRGTQLTWTNNYTDYLLRSDQQTSVNASGILTDGLMTVVRKNGGTVSKFSLAEGTSLTVDAAPLITVTGGRASVASDGTVITVSDPSRGYTIAGQGIASVVDGLGAPLAFVAYNGFIYINTPPPPDLIEPGSISDLEVF